MPMSDLDKELQGFMDLEGEAHEPETVGADEGVDTGQPETVVEQDAAEATVDDNSNKSANDQVVKPTAEPSELDELKAANQALLVQLNALSQRVDVQNAEVKPEAKPETAPDYFGDWSFDKIIEDETSFKKFLGEFAHKVKAVTEESVLTKLPGTVSKLTTEQMEARKTVDLFYTENSELAAAKPFVAQVVQTVASEHADWSLEQVLAEASTRAYKALGLQKKVVADEKRKPAFAGPASGNRTASAAAAKSKLEKELEELMELE